MLKKYKNNEVRLKKDGKKLELKCDKKMGDDARKGLDIKPARVR